MGTRSQCGVAVFNRCKQIAFTAFLSDAQRLCGSQRVYWQYVANRRRDGVTQVVGGRIISASVFGAGQMHATGCRSGWSM